MWKRRSLQSPHIIEQVFTDAADGTGVSRTGSLLGVAARQGRQSVDSQSQGSVFDQKQIAATLKLPLGKSGDRTGR